MLIAIVTPNRQQQIDQWNADTDAAVEIHAQSASRLQAQLDSLDADLLGNVLSGTETPPEAIEQRRRILSELDEINRALEQRCERNQRAIDMLTLPY